jgi:hypothetical protein
MAVPAPWRGRLSCVALTAACACPLAPAVGGPLEAPSTYPPYAGAPQYAARGIGALSPVQPVPVRPAPSFDNRAVPLDPTPCDLRPAEPGQDSAVQPPPGQAPEDGAAIPGLGASLSGDGSGDAAPPAAPLGCGQEAPPEPPPEYALDLESADIPRGPVMVYSGVSRRSRAWFSSVGGQGGLRYGDQNWIYRDTSGPAVAVGNLNTNAPFWGSAAPVGGLQISNWTGSGAALPEGRFGYSSSVGRLNRMAPGASSGAVDYGASVGSGTVRYGLTPALTVEGQMQSAPTLTTRGMGTTYQAGDYGTIQAGATQSSFDAVNAWRYRFGYNVDVSENLNLGYTNEQIGAGFGDLSSYGGGGVGTAQTRNTLSAGVPIHGWGTLSGTYSGLREGTTLSSQRVGLAHSMFVAPTVKLAVGADRDILTGNYEWRANLSMPVDTFMRGTWLQW